MATATATQATQVQADGIVAQYKPANGGTATARIVRKSGAYVVQAPGHLIQGIETEQAARDELAAMGFVVDPSVQIMGGRVIAGVPQYKRDQAEIDRRVAHKQQQEKIAARVAADEAMRDAVVSVVRTFSAALAPVAAQDRKRAERAAKQGKPASKTAAPIAKPSKAATRIAAENATAKARADAKQDKPATGKPASASKTAAAPASAPKTASKTAKPAKQDKAPREKPAKPAKPATIEQATAVVDRVQCEAIWRGLGEKDFFVRLALAAGAGRDVRCKHGNDGYLRFVLSEVSNRYADAADHAGMPASVRSAAQSLEAAINAGALQDAPRAYITRSRVVRLIGILAELASRQVGTAGKPDAATYCNAWDLRLADGLADGEAWHRRFYHCQAEQETGFRHFKAMVGNGPAYTDLPTPPAKPAPAKPATPAKVEPPAKPAGKTNGKTAKPGKPAAK